MAKEKNYVFRSPRMCVGFIAKPHNFMPMKSMIP